MSERVTKKQFVEAYLSSKSYDELASKLGITKQYCQIKASYYRTKCKIDLPKFANGGLVEQIQNFLD